MQVQHALGVLERRACRVVGQARASHRHHAAAQGNEPPLVTRLIALAGEYGRYGYRRVTALLRREGWRVDHIESINGWGALLQAASGAEGRLLGIGW